MDILQTIFLIKKKLRAFIESHTLISIFLFVVMNRVVFYYICWRANILSDSRFAFHDPDVYFVSIKKSLKIDRERELSHYMKVR